MSQVMSFRRFCSVLPLLFTPLTAITTAEDIETRAIVPTAAGQIGINPVDYEPPSGINTGDFSYSTSGTTSTSKWIGHDTAWETQGPSTTTTYSVKVSTVSDVPAGVTGISPADIYIEIPPHVKDILLNHAKTACGAPAKEKRSLEKRQNACAALSSPENYANAVDAYANAVANDPAVVDILTNPFEHVPMFTAPDIQRAVAAIKLAGGAAVSTALKNKVAVAAVFFGIFAATGNMPQQAKVEKQSQKADATYPSTTPPVTSTSSTSCQATGKIKPACQDKTNCDGDNSKTCQAGKYKKCKCAAQGKGIYHTVSAKQYVDTYNMAQAALGQYDDTVNKAVSAHWCNHQCNQDSKPNCVCACSGQTYSVAAKTTQNPLGPTDTPTDNVGVFWWQPCPYISGDPGLSKITVTQSGNGVVPTVGPSSFPNYKPAASSKAASGPPGNVGNFNRKTATDAVKARCGQLAKEGKAPSEDWPGTCATPNTDANWVVPAQNQGTGGCIWERGQSDIDWAMSLNMDNDLCKDAGYEKLKFDQGECETAFQTIIDAFPDTQDMTKKYGGSYYSSGCWRYTLTANYHCTGYANPCPEVKTKYCEAGWGDVCK
ncbi:MAG: hypothetical protein Q9160_007229 [Pyrenula sp. 1 TL-2023]